MLGSGGSRKCSSWSLTHQRLSSKSSHTSGLTSCQSYPPLFTLYTPDFCYNSELCHIQRYADDTAILGCIRDGNKNEYRSLMVFMGVNKTLLPGVKGTIYSSTPQKPKNGHRLNKIQIMPTTGWGWGHGLVASIIFYAHPRRTPPDWTS